jgi:surface antigen
MSPTKTIAAIGLAGLILAGCQTGSDPGGGEASGSVIGPTIGAIFGDEFGRQLDEADQRLLYDAQYRALEYGNTGTPVSWKNKKSGHNGEVVPGAGYKINASNCRDFTSTVFVDGQPRVARGTACREPDGAWKAIT